MSSRAYYSNQHSNRQGGGLANVVAALCSFFLPGLGQLIQGRVFSATFFFLSTTILYALSFLLIPYPIALLMHLWAIISAAIYGGD